MKQVKMCSVEHSNVELNDTDLNVPLHLSDGEVVTDIEEVGVEVDREAGEEDTAGNPVR